MFWGMKLAAFRAFIISIAIMMKSAMRWCFGVLNGLVNEFYAIAIVGALNEETAIKNV